MMVPLTSISLVYVISVLFSTNSAMSTVVQCTDTGECTTYLECIGADACKATTITCPTNTNCIITCLGKAACSDSIIDGNGATDVTIECSGEDACKVNALTCGSGSCYIDCIPEHGTCNDLTVNTNGAASFMCANSCPVTVLAQIYTFDPTKAPTKLDMTFLSIFTCFYRIQTI